MCVKWSRYSRITSFMAKKGRALVRSDPEETLAIPAPFSKCSTTIVLRGELKGDHVF